MESSGCVGVMAVVAVSGSVALVSLQIHKRLVSDFMKKVELELGAMKVSRPKKKKVKFAADVIERSTDNEEYRRRRRSGRPVDGTSMMPKKFLQL